VARGPITIGGLIALYCEGRRDALAGVKRKRRRGASVDHRALYLLGLCDERARMALERRLAQTRLDLFPEGET
jgi:hypothetical protein